MNKKEEENRSFSGLYLNGYEISRRSTEDLKRILGNFEKEYNENAMGEVEHNEILGYAKKGTIDHALKVEAITRRYEEIYDKGVDYVHSPEYQEYDTKVRIIRQLLRRREYARKINSEM